MHNLSVELPALEKSNGKGPGYGFMGAPNYKMPAGVIPSGHPLGYEVGDPPFAVANGIRSLVEEKETKMRGVYTPHHTTPYHPSSDTFYHTPSDTSSNTSLSSLTSFYRILSRTIAA